MVEYVIEGYYRAIIYSLICWHTDSVNGKLSCGYSSFRGKRASMEDFFDIKTSEVDGQTVSLFGIYDGLLCLDHSFSFLHFVLSYGGSSLLLMIFLYRPWWFTCC